MITTDDIDKVGKIITAISHENAASNTSKPGLLRQVGSLIDRAKVTTVEENNWSKKDGLSKQTRQTLPQPTSDCLSDCNLLRPFVKVSIYDLSFSSDLIVVFFLVTLAFGAFTFCSSFLFSKCSFYGLYR